MGKRVWTKERIIEELKQWRKHGPKFNSKLYGAARLHFGSLGNALKIAGLPCKRSAPRNHWSKQAVIEAIRNRYHKCQMLEGVHIDDRALYEASKKHFGTWMNARAAAGFPVPPKDYYSAEEVQLRIIELYERNLPLSFRSHRDMNLIRSSKKHFGCWRRAVKSLGLGNELTRTWTKQAVVDAVMYRRACGLSLHATQEDKGLCAAATKYFGNWHNALESVGIYARVRECWCHKKVIERLRQFSAKYDVRSIRRLDPKLTTAAERRFGSIKNALQAAGIEIQDPRWTPQRVIDEIRLRYLTEEHPTLSGFGKVRFARAAKLFFGSWAEAVEAAGLIDRIPVKKPRIRWTKQEVIHEIQNWHAKHGTFKGIAKKRPDLVSTARLHFGKWKIAVEAAGLTTGKWSRKIVLLEIQQRHHAGTSLSCSHANNIHLASVSRHYFGSWTAALRAAGVPTKPRKPRRSK